MSTPPAQPATRPKDYRLALPGGWSRIDVRPGFRETAVEALLDRQFRGISTGSRLRRQLRDQLLAMAQQAHAAGGIEIYLCHQDILGVPIPASLVISLTPPAPDGRTLTPQQLAGTMAEGQEVTLIELPAGTAVRARRRTVPEPGEVTGNSLAVTSLTIHLPVPATGRYLILAFSTNLDPVADSLAGLFDAIAGTLQWVP